MGTKKYETKKNIGIFFIFPFCLHVELIDATCSGISSVCDDSIFVSLAEPCISMSKLEDSAGQCL